MTTYGFSAEKGIKCAEGYKTAVQASATKTADFTATASLYTDCRAPDWFVIVVAVTAISGTNATVVMNLQGADQGTSYVDIDGAVMTGITATGRYLWLIKNPKRYKYIKMFGTVTGTTPSITLSIDCAAIGMMVEVSA